eukprot:415750-Prymnesium_polylepis.2
MKAAHPARPLRCRVYPHLGTILVSANATEGGAEATRRPRSGHRPRRPSRFVFKDIICLRKSPKVFARTSPHATVTHRNATAPPSLLLAALLSRFPDRGPSRRGAIYLPAGRVRSSYLKLPKGHFTVKVYCSPHSAYVKQLTEELNEFWPGLLQVADIQSWSDLSTCDHCSST